MQRVNWNLRHLDEGMLYCFREDGDHKDVGCPDLPTIAVGRRAFPAGQDHRGITHLTGLQLRRSEQNGFHDSFLISQPNPMM